MNVIDIAEIAQGIIESINKKIKSLKRLNIIVAGKTGVGKSTLINAVFKENLAETGIGRPVTTNMRKIEKKDIPLSIYDTRGFELGKEVQDEVRKEIIDTIHKGFAAKDADSMIHCIWYCINTASNRIEPNEIEWLRKLSEENKTTQVPIIVILTQSFSTQKAEEMKKIILDENLGIIQVVQVLAEDYEIEDLGVKKAYGLDTLIKIMNEALPDELLDTLQNVQIASLEEKKRHAKIAVRTAVAAATTAGATPIPFSDAAVLIPTQITMIASITAIFGLNVNQGIITTIISSTIGAGGATVLGKTVASNLLKIIPGVGTVVGGAISAVTAATITGALGYAYIAVMEMAFKGELDLNDLSTPKGEEIIAEKFKEELKRKK